MQSIEQKLALGTGALFSGLPAGFGNAKDQLACRDPAKLIFFKRKGQHVRRTTNPHEAIVQRGHFPVTD
jgi:hypothetical protein